MQAKYHIYVQDMRHVVTSQMLLFILPMCSKCRFLTWIYLQSKSIFHIFHIISLCMTDIFVFVL